jgi:hypothetical protein
MKKAISVNLENEEIVYTDLTDRENLELVIVCKSGNVFLFDCQTEMSSLFTKLPFNPYQLNLQIHSFENFVCITQKNGLQGTVINLSNSSFQKKLERIDYHAAHCIFPIAFYKKEKETFLIHGTDWNRLDITFLETDELLTNRIVNYETNSNYFDYLHSSLLISPDAKHFSSNGWVWGPYDIITVYSIEKFLKEFEMSHTSINFEPVDGYNWDRPLCWIDNTILGIGYNKKEAGESKEDFISEIIFVDIVENQMINRIEFDGFELSEYGATVGELFFDSDKKQFIGLNKKSGLLITDITGNVTYKNNSLTSHKYSIRHNLFYHFDHKQKLLEIKKLEN